MFIMISNLGDRYMLVNIKVPVFCVNSRFASLQAVLLNQFLIDGYSRLLVRYPKESHEILTD